MTRTDWIHLGKRLGWIGFLFAIAALVISAIEHRQASKVREVVIAVAPLADSSKLITEGDVGKLIERSFGYALPGTPLKVINVERLERVLEEDPFIMDAEAFVDARDVVSIMVRQRVPVLRIIDNNGLNYYLDEEGIRMPQSRHYTTHTLVATGNIPPYVPDFLERKNYPLGQLFELTEDLRSDPFFKALFEQVHLNNKGEFTLIPMVGDQKILFGTLERKDKKLRALKAFYQEGIPYQGWRKYRIIDLRYRGQVVCR